MKDEKIVQPLVIPYTVRLSKRLFLLMPFSGLAVLIAVYISDLAGGYSPGIKYIGTAVFIIAVLSVLMIFIINKYNIKFEYDHFEWKDFIKKKEIAYLTIKEVNAYEGIKGKKNYSFIEVSCTTGEKPYIIDTRFYDRQAKTQIIRLINMKAHDAKMNYLAISWKKMRDEKPKSSNSQTIYLIIILIILVAAEYFLKVKK